MDIRSLLPMTTSDVRVRQLMPRDAEAYAHGSGDTAVRRFAHLPEPHYTPELVREQIDSVITPGLSAGALAVLAIADVDSDEFLGSVVLFDIGARSAEVGFWLAPSARGRGVAGNAVACAARLGSALGLDELVARTVSTNVASGAVLTRAGFTARGTPEEDTTPSGERAVAQAYVRRL